MPSVSTSAGSSSGFMYQTRPISENGRSPLGPITRPSATRTSSRSHCSRCAPMVCIRSTSTLQARETAPPAMTMLREA